MNSSEPKLALLPNKAYDVIKALTTIILPGLGALYFGLSQIWGLPFANELNGTVNLIVVFLGLLLGLSTKTYNRSDEKFAGDITAIQDPKSGKRVFQIWATNEQIDSLLESDKDEAVFRLRSE